MDKSVYSSILSAAGLLQQTHTAVLGQKEPPINTTVHEHCNRCGCTLHYSCSCGCPFCKGANRGSYKTVLHVKIVHCEIGVLLQIRAVCSKEVDSKYSNKAGKRMGACL